MTREIPSYNTVGQFDIKVSCHEFLGASGGANLGNVTADAVDTAIYDAIQREIQKFTGDAAMNVEITCGSGRYTLGQRRQAFGRVTIIITPFDSDGRPLIMTLKRRKGRWVLDENTSFPQKFGFIPLEPQS